MTFRDELIAAGRASRRPLPADVVEACARHFDLLLRWNKTHNLTRIVAPAEAARKHYLDCLVPLLDARDGGLEPSAFVDVGSGAGFPGLLACIAWPLAQATLVEPAQKRASFLMLAAAAMGVKVSVVSSVDASPLALSDEPPKVLPLVASATLHPPVAPAETSAPLPASREAAADLVAPLSIVLSRATFSPGKRAELVRAAGSAIAVWGHAHDGATWKSEVATWRGWRAEEQPYAVDGLEPRSLLWAVRGEFHVKHARSIA